MRLLLLLTFTICFSSETFVGKVLDVHSKPIKEFVNMNPSLLMKAIGGLFHQLLISNEEELKEDEFEQMLKNFLKPNV